MGEAGDTVPLQPGETVESALKRRELACPTFSELQQRYDEYESKLFPPDSDLPSRFLDLLNLRFTGISNLSLGIYEYEKLKLGSSEGGVDVHTTVQNGDAGELSMFFKVDLLEGSLLKKIHNQVAIHVELVVGRSDPTEPYRPHLRHFAIVPRFGIMSDFRDSYIRKNGDYEHDHNKKLMYYSAWDHELWSRLVSLDVSTNKTWLHNFRGFCATVYNSADELNDRPIFPYSPVTMSDEYQQGAFGRDPITKNTAVPYFHVGVDPQSKQAVLGKHLNPGSDAFAKQLFVASDLVLSQVVVCPAAPGSRIGYITLNSPSNRTASIYIK